MVISCFKHGTREASSVAAVLCTRMFVWMMNVAIAGKQVRSLPNCCAVTTNGEPSLCFARIPSCRTAFSQQGTFDQP